MFVVKVLWWINNMDKKFIECVNCHSIDTEIEPIDEMVDEYGEEIIIVTVKCNRCNTIFDFPDELDYTQYL